MALTVQETALSRGNIQCRAAAGCAAPVVFCEHTKAEGTLINSRG